MKTATLYISVEFSDILEERFYVQIKKVCKMQLINAENFAQTVEIVLVIKDNKILKRSSVSDTKKRWFNCPSRAVRFLKLGTRALPGRRDIAEMTGVMALHYAPPLPFAARFRARRARV